MIKIPYNGKDYFISFTRNTAAALERSGFSATDMYGGKIVTNLPKLVHWAFKAKHPTITAEEAEKVWSAQRRKSDLMIAVAEEYQNTITTLLDDVDDEDGVKTEGDEGNETPMWEVVT